MFTSKNSIKRLVPMQGDNSALLQYLVSKLAYVYSFSGVASITHCLDSQDWNNHGDYIVANLEAMGYTVNVDTEARYSVILEVLLEENKQ